MNMTKQETAALAILGLLMLGGGAAYASSNKGKTPASAGPPPPKPPLPPDADGAALLKRANQRAALDWAGVFLDHPVTPLASAALARWAGIESSGNPLSKSRLDERGLMQVGPHAVAEHELTQTLYDAILDPTTSRKVQADIAIAYVDALASKAAAHLLSEPTDPIDRIWYAKLYHQRPVEVRDVYGPLTKQFSTTDAKFVAHVAAGQLASNAQAMHRLRAANVVAFGTPNP
jgi:Transglycosylase SLT domain